MDYDSASYKTPYIYRLPSVDELDKSSRSDSYGSYGGGSYGGYGGYNDCGCYHEPNQESYLLVIFLKGLLTYFKKAFKY